MSLPQIVKATRFTAPSILRRPAEAYPTAIGAVYDLFTVTGNILLRALTAVVVAPMPAGANVIDVRAVAVAMDNGGFDLDGLAAGTRIIVMGAVAVELSISGLAASSPTTATLPWIVCPGVIDVGLATDTGTGTLMWELEWQPLTANATVIISP